MSNTPAIGPVGGVVEKPVTPLEVRSGAGLGDLGVAICSDAGLRLRDALTVAKE